jgi:hypothetical protein
LVPPGIVYCYSHESWNALNGFRGEIPRSARNLSIYVLAHERAKSLIPYQLSVYLVGNKTSGRLSKPHGTHSTALSKQSSNPELVQAP